MLTSSHNPRIMRARALLDQRKARDAERAFVVEGVRLAEEALQAGWTPDEVLVSETLSGRGRTVVDGFAHQGTLVYEVSARVMDALTGTQNPQGLLAIFPRRALTLPKALNLVLIVDTLRDPGNLGTLLRSAAAAGVQAALLSTETTDAFAPKVLRAGMGAHFHLPVLDCTWEQIGALCQAHALRVLLADALGAPCWQTDFIQPLALLVGGEADGATPPARALADQTVAIPMPGQSESLNAAVAASILLFEAVRQRAGSPASESTGR